MKYKALLLTMAIILASPMPSLAADETTRRRPDQTEFVTESHVRLTTESLTIAEINEATPTPNPTTSFWDYLNQSFAAFIQSLKAIFNLN